MSAKGTVLKRVKQSIKANIRNKNYKSSMKTAVKKVLNSDFLTQGPEVKKFEQILSNTCNAKYSTIFKIYVKQGYIYEL